MAKDLFVLSDNNHVEPLTKHHYEWEQILQQLIADNPRLISRKRSDEDPNLYLVSREIGVYNKETDKVATYSLDHLYVSGDGVPVIVEVKRSENKQLRREVVAQILDYASRASFWDVNSLQSLALDSNKNSETATSLLSSPDFWAAVDSNLKAGKMRLVFVADEIPDELATIITFLDKHLNSIEVYGVSITQYTSNGSTMYIKNIIELPEVTSENDAPLAEWDEERFLAQATSIGGAEVYDVTKKIVDWATTTFKHCGYGNGRYYARFIAYPTDTTTGHMFTIEPWGDAMRIRFSAHWNSTRSSFSEKDLASRILSLSDNKDYIKITPKYLVIDCKAFADESSFDKFKEIICEIYHYSSTHKASNSTPPRI